LVKLYKSIATFFVVFLIFSCESGGGSAPLQTFEGTWTMTKYIDNGKVKTDSFSSYSFLFYPRDTFHFYNDTSQAAGNYYYGSIGATKTIRMTTKDPKFAYINRNWLLIIYGFSFIQMINEDSTNRKITIELKRKS
jgi:hypothetical protein